jgi:hypothetical protein
METQFVEPAPHVQRFVEQLLNAGGTLVSVVENLVDALVANGSNDDEATGDIIVALMCAVASRLAAVPEADVARATELMEQAADGVLAELERAERLARRRGNHAGRRA